MSAQPEQQISIERSTCYGSWGTSGDRYFAYRQGGARIAEGRTHEEALERAQEFLQRESVGDVGKSSLRSSSGSASQVAR